MLICGKRLLRFSSSARIITEHQWEIALTNQYGKSVGVNFHGTSFDLGFIALSNLNVSNHLKQVSTKTLKCLANCSKLPSTGNCRTNKNSQSKGLASKPTTTLKISFCTWIKTGENWQLQRLPFRKSAQIQSKWLSRTGLWTKFKSQKGLPPTLQLMSLPHELPLWRPLHQGQSAWLATQMSLV